MQYFLILQSLYCFLSLSNQYLFLMVEAKSVETESAFSKYCDRLSKGTLRTRPRGAYEPEDKDGKTVEEFLPYTDIVLLKMYASEGSNMSIYSDDGRAQKVVKYLCWRVHNGKHNCNIHKGNSHESDKRQNTVKYEIRTQYTGHILADALTAAELQMPVLVAPANRRSRRFVNYVKRLVGFHSFVEVVGSHETSDCEDGFKINVDAALEAGLFSDTEMWLIGWPTDPEQRMYAGFPLSGKDKEAIERRDRKRLIDLLRQRGAYAQKL